MEKKICLKCGSPKWMTNLDDASGSLSQLGIIGSTRWGKGWKVISRVRVEACGACGYVEHFLEQPQAVYEEWRKQNA